MLSRRAHGGRRPDDDGAADGGGRRPDAARDGLAPRDGHARRFGLSQRYGLAVGAAVGSGDGVGVAGGGALEAVGVTVSVTMLLRRRTVPFPRSAMTRSLICVTPSGTRNRSRVAGGVAYVPRMRAPGYAGKAAVPPRDIVTMSTYLRARNVDVQVTQ